MAIEHSDSSTPSSNGEIHEIKQTEGLVTIYGLVCPVDNSVRYVGKAVDVNVRYRRHIGKTEMAADNHKTRWLKRLMANGLHPGLVILEEVSEGEWEKREMFWIKELRAKGCNLTNSTPGGEGVKRGTKRPPEVIAKIAAASAGRIASPETREKMRQRMLGTSMSDSTRAKLSDSHKKAWEALPDDEKRTRSARLRHGWSDETRAKASVTRRGRKMRKNVSSPYVGVSFFKRDSNWRAYITVDGKHKHVGYFPTAEEATAARTSAELKLHGPLSVSHLPKSV